MGPAIQALRDATGDIHQRLHHHPAFRPLMSPDPDAGGYGALLLQLRGFHVPVERVLFAGATATLPELDDLPARRKAHLIEADVASLHGHPPAETPSPAIEPPARDSRPAVLGALYVIEGATLGGRELAGRIEPALRALGLAGSAGRRFLLAYEPNQGAMWRRFCATLEAAAADFTPANHRTMHDAARETFLALEEWLTHGLAVAE